MSPLFLLVPAGFLAGFVDAIAGGGGLVTMPSLLVCGLSPAAAIATNKGQAVFGAVASVASFFRAGGVDRRAAPLAFALGFFSSFGGALLVTRASPSTLRVLVTVLLPLAACSLLLPRKHLPRLAHPHPWMGPVVAILFGAYDGFFGPGTGSFLIVAYVLFLGQTLRHASANAKVVNFGSNLAAFLFFAWHGTIVWTIALPMALANFVGASIGAHLAWRKGEAWIRGFLLAVAFAASAKLVFDALSARTHYTPLSWTARPRTNDRMNARRA